MNKTRYIKAGCLIDGSGEALRKNVYLEVKDGIITAIGAVADLPPHNPAAIDDLSHCTLLPALVDCNVSLLRSPAVDANMRLMAEKADPAEMTALFARHVSYCHNHGVLGIIDSNDNLGLMRSLQGQQEQSGLLEVRLSVSTFRHNLYEACENDFGGDFIKISYSASIEDEEDTTPRPDHEELCRLIRLKGNKKAVVIANGPRHVKEALEAGCDAVEQGYGMGAENLQTMAKKNVLWIPNLLRAKNALDGSSTSGSVCCRFSHRYVAPGKPLPGAEAFWKKVLAEQLDQLRLARKIGVQTAIGTGAGSVGILHGESMVDEIKLFIKTGYSLEAAIRCASSNGADFFNLEHLGKLTVGNPATFLVTRGSAKQLPRKLAYLEGIYIRGVPSRDYRKNPVKTVVPKRS